MRTALFVLILCAAADLVAISALLAVVWVEHRRVRREAERTGDPIPAADAQFGCLIAAGLIGLVAFYAAAWLLLRK